MRWIFRTSVFEDGLRWLNVEVARCTGSDLQTKGTPFSSTRTTDDSERELRRLCSLTAAIVHKSCVATVLHCSQSVQFPSVRMPNVPSLRTGWVCTCTYRPFPMELLFATYATLLTFQYEDNRSEPNAHEPCLAPSLTTVALSLSTRCGSYPTHTYP